MYIIIGGSGFLGRYIVKNIINFTNEKIIATYTRQLPQLSADSLQWLKCDVQKIDDIQFLNSASESNAKVVYLASYASPDFCEKNPDKAWDLNVTGLSNFVNKFKKAACLYYASTDVVYGESLPNTKFNESSLLNPSNIYGVQKVAAEQIVLANGYNVFRLPLMMGPSLIEGKKHFFDHIYESLSNARPIEMFADSYRSTLSFDQCAKFLIALIEKFGACEKKIVNFASDNALSKYELALKIADYYNLNKELIKGISIQNSDNIFSAKRAAITEMDNNLLKSLLKLKYINLEFDKEKKDFVLC